MSSVKEMDLEYIVNTYARFDVTIMRGEGARCYDENEREYIDFTSGIGVNSLGFCNKDWSQAVCEQVNTLQHISNLYYTAPDVKLAEKLAKITGYKRVFFGNSGAEANEGAIKIARKYSFDKYGADAKRNKVISLVNSFHGRTVTTLAATGQDVFHNYFFPFTEGFSFAAPNDIDSVKEQIDDKTCAIILECVQGEGGVVPLNADFVTAVFKLCEQHDILLIADEVQTGVGRTGKFLASENFNIKPDITTLAKGLGGGLPIGAVLCNEKTASVLGFGDHGTTFGGNPVVCAGANVCVDTIANAEFLAEVCKKAEYIKSKLLGCAEVCSITGMGLMIGIKLHSKTSKDVAKACAASGLLVLTAKEKVRLLPPLTITYDEIDRGLQILLSNLK